MKLAFKKKEKVFRKGGFHTNPDIGWEVVLYFNFALIIGGFVFGYFLWGKVNEEYVLPPNISNERKAEEAQIAKALEYFSERGKKSAEILKAPSPFVDPSK
ncbi:MAG: hypothetical protein AAB500_01065 [Patescibacteria group bacterium]